MAFRFPNAVPEAPSPKSTNSNSSSTFALPASAREELPHPRTPTKMSSCHRCPSTQPDVGARPPGPELIPPNARRSASNNKLKSERR